MPQLDAAYRSAGSMHPSAPIIEPLDPPTVPSRPVVEQPASAAQIVGSSSSQDAAGAAAGSSPIAGPAGASASVGRLGFGSRATGGSGATVVLFTNLNDAGPGSLREALAGSNRYVMPAPGLNGTVKLTSRLDATGDNWTFDGKGAVTLPRTLFISGASNWVVTQVRFRMQSPVDEDAITVKNGASNGIIDHVSISGWTDGAIDITVNCHDITVQWSLLAEGRPGHDYTMLMGHNSGRISVHHNLIYRTEYRNPQGFHNESTTGTGTPSAVTVDFVNNLVWDFELYGTQAARRGWVNAINNVYYSTAARGSGRALLAETGGRLFQGGNVGLNGVVIDGGTEAAPFAVPGWARVEATDAISAARAVLAEAGARSLDTADAARVASVSLP
jgi:hypothetical protein